MAAHPVNTINALWAFLAATIALSLLVIVAGCAYFLDRTPANLLGLCSMLAVLSLLSVWFLIRASEHDR